MHENLNHLEPYRTVCFQICQLGIGYRTTNCENYEETEEAFKSRVIHYSPDLAQLYIPPTITAEEASQALKIFQASGFPLLEIVARDRDNLRRWHKSPTHGPDKLFLNSRVPRITVLGKRDKAIMFSRLDSEHRLKILFMWLPLSESVISSLPAELVRMLTEITGFHW